MFCSYQLWNWFFLLNNDSSQGLDENLWTNLPLNNLITKQNIMTSKLKTWIHNKINDLLEKETYINRHKNNLVLKFSICKHMYIYIYIYIYKIKIHCQHNQPLAIVLSPTAEKPSWDMSLPERICHKIKWSQLCAMLS